MLVYKESYLRYTSLGASALSGDMPASNISLPWGPGCASSLQRMCVVSKCFLRTVLVRQRATINVRHMVQMVVRLLGISIIVWWSAECNT